ncbi:adenosine/AMP deaminase-like protein [Streptomyces sp. 2333.5]|uniref:hypothetical protein n=1 Tax=unclassified Streptomyces TaxID=2593676 RepID=UPI0008998854|nr:MULTISPECIES: hypothetical protein [unclassified Streptomyces]PJI99866.1 adenosine/AMP deaminase-like protein [Streptomyces sp. 2333.5]SEB62324.1 Adenosine/AMP deaminase [Streptomyces sp. 2314.4]SEC46009.1 Adenosine/AMP deaminase [Streptomyces sp. 2112.2]
MAVCADDPALFCTTLTNEYLVAAGRCGLSAEALRALARGTAHAALLDDSRRTHILDEIDRFGVSENSEQAEYEGTACPHYGTG